MSTALWVVGTTRSGTSWAFDLVASHPDVSMGYESKIPIEGIAVYERWRDRLIDPLAMAGSSRTSATRSTIRRTPATTRSCSPSPTSTCVCSRRTRRSPGWATICEHFFRSVEGTSHWGNKLLRVELHRGGGAALARQPLPGAHP